MGFPGGSDGKESACNAETWVRSLGWDDPLEEDIATHSSILAWRIPVDRGTWWATVHGVAESDMTDLAQHSKYPIKARGGTGTKRVSIQPPTLPTLGTALTGGKSA